MRASLYPNRNSNLDPRNQATTEHSQRDSADHRIIDGPVEASFTTTSTPDDALYSRWTFSAYNPDVADLAGCVQWAPISTLASTAGIERNGEWPQSNSMAVTPSTAGATRSRPGRVDDKILGSDHDASGSVGPGC